jgi:hypothetical protein
MLRVSMSARRTVINRWPIRSFGLLGTFLAFSPGGTVWTGLAPDDSPLLIRDASSHEIYAMDWQAP